MKKIFYAIIAIAFFIAGPLYGATRTFDNGAADGGKWSTAANWSDDTLPGNGDTAALDSYTVVMDIATIPATGSLAGITATSGQLTVDMSATGLNGNATINCGTGNLQAGTNNNGLIYLSVASTNTLTINGNLLAGSGTYDHALKVTTTGNNPTINITGNVSAGGGETAQGIMINNATYSGAITITGNLSGGSGARAVGVIAVGSTDTTGSLTVNGSIINGSGGVAYMWPDLTWTPGYGSYFSPDGGTTKLYAGTDPGVANVKSGTTYYFQSATEKTGTLASGGGSSAW